MTLQEQLDVFSNLSSDTLSATASLSCGTGAP
jgi:hypothetical protein